MRPAMYSSMSGAVNSISRYLAGSEFRDQGFGLRVQDLAFRDEGSGFRVHFARKFDASGTPLQPYKAKCSDFWIKSRRVPGRWPSLGNNLENSTRSKLISQHVFIN